MSFRQAATSVRAGIKSGAYQKKTDNFSAFAQGFAPIFAQGMKDKKDLKMAEMKTIAEEKRYQRRLTDAAQAKTDLYDKKTQEVAERLWEEWGITDTKTQQEVLETVAAANNNYLQVDKYYADTLGYQRPTLGASTSSGSAGSTTDSAISTSTPPAAVTSQAVGYTDPLSKGEGNDDIDALYNLTKGKLSGKFANYKVSQNTIGANLDFARKGGESGYFDSSIGLVEGMPNAGTTPMGKWQFVHTTLEDMANRTNNFKDLGEGFENGLNTIFDAKAQDKIHAWYINDTLNQARKDGGNTQANFVDRLKARYEAFQKENPTTGKVFTDQEILNTVMPFVASRDKTTWATGGSWFGTVDYGDAAQTASIVGDADTQTQEILSGDASVEGGFIKGPAELFTSKLQIQQIANDPTHRRYVEAVEMNKILQAETRGDAASAIAGATSTRKVLALEASLNVMGDSEFKTKVLEALPALKLEYEILDAVGTADAATLLMKVKNREGVAAMQAAIGQMADGDLKTKLMAGLAELSPKLNALDPIAPPVETGPLRDANGKLYSMDYIQQLIFSRTPAEKAAAEAHIEAKRNYDATNPDFQKLDTPAKVAAYLTQADFRELTIDAKQMQALNDHTAAMVKRAGVENLPPITSLGSVADVVTYRSLYKGAYGENAVIPQLIEDALQVQEEHWRVKEERAKAVEARAAEVPLPPYMTTTVTTGNIADFTANVDAALKGMSKDDPNRMALLDRSLHLKTVQAEFDAAKKNNSKFKLLKSYQFIKYKDKDGKEKRVQVQLTDQGGLYYRGDFIDREDVISYEPTSDQIIDAVNIANKFTADFGDKLRQTKTDTITLVSTAKQLDDLVRANPDILTLVGGEGSTFISGLITELNQVAKAINGPQMSSAKLQEQLLSAGDQKIREFVQNSTDSYVKNNAQAFYQFTALNLKHAFSFAKLSLDSAGMALSNFDFKNSLTINNVGKDYKTYSKNLRTMTSGVLRDATGRHDLLLENLEFNVAMENDLIKGKMTGTDTIMPLSDYITRQLPDAVNWATSTVEGTTGEGNEGGDGGGGSTALPDFNAFLNNQEELQARFALYRQVVTEGDSDDLEKFYERTAKRFYGPNFTDDNLSFVKESLLDRFSSMGGN